MKGVIFNSLEEAVIEIGGEDLWDELLERGGLDGSYTSLGSYSDDDLMSLVNAAAEVLNMTPQEATVYAGRLVAPKLAQRHSDLVASHTDTISLLCDLNDVIHPEVRKLYPNAQVPDFTTIDRADSRLILQYRSERNLVSLATGLILGAAELFGETVDITTDLTTDGCVFHLEFTR